MREERERQREGGREGGRMSDWENIGSQCAHGTVCVCARVCVYMRMQVRACEGYLVGDCV